MAKVRVGLVGCGFVAELHMYAYKRVYGLDAAVTAVVARSDRVLDFAKKHQIRATYRDFRDLLADREIDVVDICTPPLLHATMIVEAVRAGKHVICEKPFAGYFGRHDDKTPIGKHVPKALMYERVLEEMEETCAAIKSSGRLFMYAEDWVYAPAVAKTVEILNATKDKILFMKAEESHSGSHAAHAADWSMTGGGSLIRMGCHPLSTALFLKQVEARARGERIAVSAVTADVGNVAAVLAAIQEWNARQTDGRVRFTTQISIDAASDTEMLEMCADAGLTHVFIGIETPNEVSLREAKKRQNLKRNLLDEIQRIVNYGISVDCGMIVGFDNDEVDIFRRQYEFAMATAVPIFSLGALVAPAATPLHARLAKAGRLVEDGAEIAATPWSTNVIPAKMTRQELVEGIRWLCNSIYHPAAFEQRMSKLVDTLGSTRVPLFARQETQVAKPRAVGTDGARMLQRIRHLGPDEEKMFLSIIKKLRGNRQAASEVLGCMLQYCQVRHMYERCQFWDPTLVPDADPMWHRQPIGAAERPGAPAATALL